MLNISQIKQLREETGAAVMDCQKALEQSNGDFPKAKIWLEKKGFERAEKKADRETGQGLIEAYVHGTGKVGALIALSCETDFVARTPEFKNLAHELVMQAAAMEPKDVKELLAQEYIRDPKIKIADLIKQTIAKLGENIKIANVSRLKL